MFFKIQIINFLNEVICNSGGLRTNASNIAPYLYKPKNHFKSEDEEILDAVRMVIPFFDDFLLEVDDFGPKKSVNLSIIDNFNAEDIIVVNREVGASTF